MREPVDPKEYSGCDCTICLEIVAGITKVWKDDDENITRMETDWSLARPEWEKMMIEAKKKVREMFAKRVKEFLEGHGWRVVERDVFPEFFIFKDYSMWSLGCKKTLTWEERKKVTHLEETYLIPYLRVWQLGGEIKIDFAIFSKGRGGFFNQLEWEPCDFDELDRRMEDANKARNTER